MKQYRTRVGEYVAIKLFQEVQNGKIKDVRLGTKLELSLRKQQRSFSTQQIQLVIPSLYSKQSQQIQARINFLRPHVKLLQGKRKGQIQIKLFLENVKYSKMDLAPSRSSAMLRTAMFQFIFNALPFANMKMRKLSRKL